MTYWKRLDNRTIATKVENALAQNVHFDENAIIGVPASFLDRKVFHTRGSILDNAPFLQTMIQNPNHIGCHTLGASEPFFQGTHALEKELIQICATDIFGGKPDEQDGYVASGGTEANIQAIWTFRNYFQKECDAPLDSIAIVCSEDTHYSVHKASNLLGLQCIKIAVDPNNRNLIQNDLRAQLKMARKQGITHLIVVVNMLTTMFGSVDDIDLYTQAIKQAGFEFRLHIDGAFGGLIFPFSSPEKAKYSFQNPDVHSIAIDAHKMLQAPYGTGIFLIQKNYLEYTTTDEAAYVHGLDSTLCGSRSGANAVAVWMILMHYGPEGWQRKVNYLLKITTWLCHELDQLSINYYRHPASNIVTISAKDMDETIARKFILVPDHHHGKAKWYKIVVMEHVTKSILSRFLTALQAFQQQLSPQF